LYECAAHTDAIGLSVNATDIVVADTTFTHNRFDYSIYGKRGITH